MMNNYFTAIYNTDSPVLIHIPHSSLYIPEDMRDDYLIDEAQLEEEKRVMADMYTDELFGGLFERFGGLRLDVSRVFLDVERFKDDNLEPMAARGMGFAYSKTSMLEDLRELKYKEKIAKIYDAYHKTLNELVDAKLEAYGKCLIVDCHSFPSVPRPYQIEKEYDGVDVCVGFDAFHKDEEVTACIKKSFEDAGYNVAENFPYSGSMVSNKHYAKEKNVKSVMIELNRKIYMDDLKTFEKRETFDKVKAIVEGLRECMHQYKNPNR